YHHPLSLHDALPIFLILVCITLADFIRLFSSWIDTLKQNSILKGGFSLDYMKPIQTTEAPTGGKWIYEVKYDGFRAQLFWKMDSIQLISRNGHDMTHLFPEIGAYCREHQSAVQSLLPVVLDGELVVLNHASQANFERIQSRGRLKNTDRIRQSARKRPAALLAFD